MALTASAPASTADQAVLKASVASSAGVSEDRVRRFAVDSLKTSRRHRRLGPASGADGAGTNDIRASDAGGGARSTRRLATYSWTVTCDVVADLALVGGGGGLSPQDFAAGVASNLAAPAFAAAVAGSVASVTSIDGSSATAVARPTPGPVPAPTRGPTAVGGGGGGGDGDSGGGSGGMGAATLGAAAAGLLVVVPAAIFACRRLRANSLTDKTFVEEEEKEDENPSAPKTVEHTSRANTPATTSSTTLPGAPPGPGKAAIFQQRKEADRARIQASQGRAATGDGSSSSNAGGSLDSAGYSAIMRQMGKSQTL